MTVVETLSVNIDLFIKLDTVYVAPMFSKVSQLNYTDG